MSINQDTGNQDTGNQDTGNQDTRGENTSTTGSAINIELSTLSDLAFQGTPLSQLANICESINFGSQEFQLAVNKIAANIKIFLDDNHADKEVAVDELSRLIDRALKSSSGGSADVVVKRIEEKLINYQNLLSELAADSKFENSSLRDKLLSDNDDARAGINQLVELYVALDNNSSSASASTLVENALTSKLLNYLLATGVLDAVDDLFVRARKEIDQHKTNVLRGVELRSINLLLQQRQPSYIEVELSNGIPAFNPKDREEAAVTANLYYLVDNTMLCLSFNYTSPSFRTWTQTDNALADKRVGSTMEELLYFVSTISDSQLNTLDPRYFKLGKVDRIDQLSARTLLGIVKNKE